MSGRSSVRPEFSKDGIPLWEERAVAPAASPFFLSEEAFLWYNSRNGKALEIRGEETVTEGIDD